MKDFKIPFTNYDIFGYILPGSCFSLGLLLVASDDVAWVRSKVEYLTAKSAIESVFFLLVVFAALYFIGHIIGCVGHLIFDRLIVRLLLGYPLYYILGWENQVEKSLKTRKIKVFLFVVLCLFFLFAPIAYYLVSIDFCRLMNIAKDYWLLSGFALMLIVVIASIVLFSKKDTCKEKSKKDDLSWQEKLCDWFVDVFREATATDTKVNGSLRNIVNGSLKSKLKMRPRNFSEYNSDIYWLANIYLTQNKDSVHSERLGDWLNMYGCLRNYSCVFFILAFIEAYRLWLSMISDFSLSSRDFFLTIIFSLLGILLFMRYWVMYYAYYSKYIIRVYALENIPKDKPKEVCPSQGAILSVWNFKDEKDEEKEPLPQEE